MRLGFRPNADLGSARTPYSLISEPMRQRIEASLQAAQTEARAAMDRHRTAVERVAGILYERRKLNAAQIADLLAGITVELVRRDGPVPAGAE